MIYAEGSLQRARHPITVRTRVVETPTFAAPAPHFTTLPRHIGPEAILDPFEVGSKSLDILSQELGALGRARLLNIIAAYGLNPGGQNIDIFTDAQLVALIVAAVEATLLPRTR